MFAECIYSGFYTNLSNLSIQHSRWWVHRVQHLVRGHFEMKQSGIDPLTTRWVDDLLHPQPRHSYVTVLILLMSINSEKKYVIREELNTSCCWTHWHCDFWILHHTLITLHVRMYRAHLASSLSFLTRLEPLASSLCVYLGETSPLGTAQICNILYTVNSLHCITRLTWMHVNIMAVDNVEPVNYMGCKVVHLSA